MGTIWIPFLKFPPGLLLRKFQPLYNKRRGSTLLFANLLLPTAHKAPFSLNADNTHSTLIGEKFSLNMWQITVTLLTFPPQASILYFLLLSSSS